MNAVFPEETVAKETSRYVVTKIGAPVVRDARIVCSISGEDLQDYLTRLLEPLVRRDKEEAFERERETPSMKPKRKSDR